MDPVQSMDPEVSVMLHCAPWRGLREQQVKVVLSARFNRQNVPELEQYIEAVWSERVTREPWLFNGAKFRLHSATLSAPRASRWPQGAGDTEWGVSDSSAVDEGASGERGVEAAAPELLRGRRKGEKGETAGRGTPQGHRTDEDREDANARMDRPGDCSRGESADTRTAVASVRSAGCRGRTSKTPQKDTDSVSPGDPEPVLLSLQLGLTCYRDFLGTNWSQRVGDLQRRGEAEFGDPQALLAQPLGVGAVMTTTDGQVVLLRRSQRVAEAAGLLDIPGGHPEPKAVCEGVVEERISAELLQGSERAVVMEIFSSVCAEIRDEVNVPLGSLSEPVLMGVALNHTSAGRPSAEFYVRCSLTTEEVEAFYRCGGPEAHESTDIVFLSHTEILELDERAPLWSELCPSAKGAVMLYRLVMPDQEEA